MKEEISCGGVVTGNNGILLLRKYCGDWVLPKGKVEQGEKHEETALREVREESGVIAGILDYLGEMHYTYTGSFHHGETIHKIVYWYLMKAESEGIVPQNEEGFVEGRYFPLDKVTSMAKYNDERKIIDAAIKKIRGK